MKYDYDRYMSSIEFMKSIEEYIDIKIELAEVKKSYDYKKIFELNEKVNTIRQTLLETVYNFL